MKRKSALEKFLSGQSSKVFWSLALNFTSELILEADENEKGVDSALCRVKLGFEVFYC